MVFMPTDATSWSLVRSAVYRAPTWSSLGSRDSREGGDGDGSNEQPHACEQVEVPVLRLEGLLLGLGLDELGWACAVSILGFLNTSALHMQKQAY